MTFSPLKILVMDVFCQSKTIQNNKTFTQSYVFIYIYIVRSRYLMSIFGTFALFRFAVKSSFEEKEDEHV